MYVLYYDKENRWTKKFGYGIILANSGGGTMKDIPLFTTENGVASLSISQIPYTAKAYIRIQDSILPDALLQECCDFCRAVGAQEIYATGHDYLKKFQRFSRILRMRCSVDAVEDTNACLFPVTEQTVERFREIYNHSMKNVPNASYMTLADSKKLIAEGSGYFVHQNGEVLGIGVVKGNKVEAISSLISGAGKTVLLTLFGALTEPVVELEVAEENKPAMALYQKTGFVPVEEIAVWYKIN